MLKARAASDIHGTGAAALHLQAEFHTFDYKGKPTGEGTVDNLQDGNGNWRETVVYNGKRTIMLHPSHEKVQYETEEDFQPTFAQANLVETLFNPVPTDERIAKAKLNLQPFQGGNVALTCVIVSLPWSGGTKSINTAPNNAYCISPDNGLLRVVEGHDGYLVSLNSFSSISQTFVARDIEIREHGVTRGKLHVTTLEANPQVTVDSFKALEHPTVPFPDRASLEGKAKPVIVNAPTPTFSEEARQLHISGEVLVAMLVGKDGHVRDTELINAPDDSLVDSALDVARHYTFKPYLVDGKPKELLLNVAINFQIFE